MKLAERNFDNEFEFITSRSSGAGGQHVNKTNSKVELRFNVLNSKLLSYEEKELLQKNIPTRINKDGILQIVSQKSRSQIKNKKDCIKRFYELLEVGLKIPKKRKKTKRSINSILKRLKNKKRQSEKKENRRKDFI
ncbi:MAG: aminoacyl-tRNA hydrolase [Bacteroidales bacterium]|nr:aminoacyl-tRNA hydrolase [Bacteroidales bacterium]